MQHPFAPDLSEKTLDELQEAISKLTGNLTYAYRTGNTALIKQLQMMIESHRFEYSKKIDEAFSKHHIETKINIQGSTDVSPPHKS